MPQASRENLSRLLKPPSREGRLRQNFGGGGILGRIPLDLAVVLKTQNKKGKKLGFFP
jgi:hypothetical protein